MEKVIIAGGGPAGLTAALYAARAGLEPLVLEGLAPGGTLAQIVKLMNYPGFPDGVAGADLAAAMKAQAERAGARFEFGAVLTGFERRASDGVLILQTDGDAVRETRTLIACTGTEPRKLGVPGEERFLGRGVSTCATCDGAFFKGRPVCVVGSGAEALGAVLYLARLCSRVTLVCEGKELPASAAATARLAALVQQGRVELRTESAATEIVSADRRRVSGVRVRGAGGAESELTCEAVFVALGAGPATAWTGGQVTLTPDGRVRVEGGCTSVPGVFAAGDVETPYTKQVVTAAAAGAIAAMAAIRYVNQASSGV